MPDPVSAEVIDDTPIGRLVAARKREGVANMAIAGLAAGSLFLLIYGTFYPGLINFDTAEMLNQAVLNYCRDWHSPMIVMIWRILNPLLAGPASLLAAGLALFLAAALRFARQNTSSLTACLAVLGLLCLWPPVLDGLVLVGKDQLFLACFMIFIALLAQAVCEDRLTAGALLWLAPLLFLSAGVRQDSAAILIPGLALLYRLPRGRAGARWSRKAAGVLAVASVVLAFAAVKGFNRFVAHAERNFPAQTTFVHDLAGIASQTDHPLIPSYAESGFDLAEMKSRYTPRNGDPLMFDLTRPSIRITDDKVHADELKDLWLHSVLRYPRAYLQHRAAAYAYFIGVEAPLSYQLYQLDTDPTMHAAYPGLVAVDLGNPDNLAVSLYRRLVPALSVTPIFRGYAYLVVILLEIGLALWRRRPTQDRLIVAIGCGVMLHQALLFLVSPAALFRYLYPSVLACLVMTILTLVRTPAKASDA